MKRMIIVWLLLIVLTTTLQISCAKKSSPDEQKNCKTCKVFGGDGVNNVIHEEQVCSDDDEKDLHSRFPGREIKCQ